MFDPSIYWQGLVKHSVDNAPSVGVLRCSMLGIKNYDRERISTVWLAPLPTCARRSRWGAVLLRIQGRKALDQMQKLAILESSTRDGSIPKNLGIAIDWESIKN